MSEDFGYKPDLCMGAAELPHKDLEVLVGKSGRSGCGS
jgi:hypothetical protein